MHIAFRPHSYSTCRSATAERLIYTLLVLRTILANRELALDFFRTYVRLERQTQLETIAPTTTKETDAGSRLKSSPFATANLNRNTVAPELKCIADGYPKPSPAVHAANGPRYDTT